MTTENKSEEVICHNPPCEYFKAHKTEHIEQGVRLKEQGEEIDDLKICHNRLAHIENAQNKSAEVQIEFRKSHEQIKSDLRLLIASVSELKESTMTKPQIENMMLKLSDDYIKKTDMKGLEDRLTAKALLGVKSQIWKVVGIVFTGSGVFIGLLSLLWKVAVQVLQK